MLKLEDIKPDSIIAGLESDQTVRILMVQKMGDDALNVFYNVLDGTIRVQYIDRSYEEHLAISEARRPWDFNADPETFKLAAEAWRINLAHLFDPMLAVHTSNVQPLPHQITAVYESMLPRQPLRYVLADDPGAGKTIMAGLLIRELVMRADVQRVLIVAPGSLVEQWQDEMREKFDLSFTIFATSMINDSQSGNPFQDHDFLIARLDQLKREEYRELLQDTQWDLIIFDEAHKLSASYDGQKIKKSKRFQLGELLREQTRHLLLMTATPHNGKEEEFQLFLSLIDPDRFYARFRNGAPAIEVNDVMRRMVKEDLLQFDGTPLFPERKATTATYALTQAESQLYEAVTTYVREEMGRADALDGSRKSAVGFALTSLQRRLASSPAAIYQSLKRRRTKLQLRIEEETTGAGRNLFAPNYLSPKLERAFQDDDNDWDIEESMPAEEYEDFEQEVSDQATAARTIEELRLEVQSLKALEEMARNLVNSRQDRKWDQLSSLLQGTPEMRDASGQLRKIIIFTEHRDTLNYLIQRIQGLLGRPDAIVTIHGGVPRHERRNVQERFRQDPECRVLVATDAAGEGVNLQNANLMVNYDLPWNPNRLEQRFGRIHRIGQTEVCHLWNMVADATREGDVFQRLFQKLEVERQALGGRVFDILGEVFSETPLKQLLIEAIRYGDNPEKRNQLYEQVNSALDTQKIRDLLDKNALFNDIMDQQRLFQIKEDMDKAEARKLQPHFVHAFFREAFEALGGKLRLRQTGRYEISRVPSQLHNQKPTLSGKNTQSRLKVLDRYERVCFDKQHIHHSKPGEPQAALLHPGHPLMRALLDHTIEQNFDLLQQGTILVDPQDMSLTPRLLFIIDHAIHEGADPSQIASRRLHFVEVDENQNASAAGWAPYLDYAPLHPDDRALIQDIVQAPWLSQNVIESLANQKAVDQLIPQHIQEIKSRREQQIDKTLQAVNERLKEEIHHRTQHFLKMQAEVAAGRQPRIQVENAEKAVLEMKSRLENRTRELQARRVLHAKPPNIMGGALIIPQGLLLHRKGQPGWSTDAAARTRVEMIAMNAVIQTEQARGCIVKDVSAEKCGWDITSTPRAADGSFLPARHIEVKGRARGQDTITVTRNEILYALNQADKFVLAIVIVDGDTFEGPFYIQNPFNKEPDSGANSINYDLKALLERARPATVPEY